MKVENFKRFSLKMLHCKARVFPVGIRLHDSQPLFTPRKMLIRMNLDHVASGHFVLGRDVFCEFDYWPLAVSMPPTKVCPQCKAVPVRRIVSCPVYFLHAVILSFDPNEKQSAICEKKLRNVWEQQNQIVGVPGENQR